MRTGKLVSLGIAALCTSLVGAASAWCSWVDPHREVYDQRVAYDPQTRDWRRDDSPLARRRMAPRGLFGRYEGETALIGGGWIVALRVREGASRGELWLVGRGEPRALVSAGQAASAQLPSGLWGVEAFELRGEYVVYLSGSGSVEDIIVRVPTHGEPTVVAASTHALGCVVYALEDRLLAVCDEHAQYEVDANGGLTSVGGWRIRPRYCDASLGRVSCTYQSVEFDSAKVHIALVLAAIAALIIALLVHIRRRPHWAMSAAGVIVGLLLAVPLHLVLWYAQQPIGGGLFLM